jgi:hypothetical protein
MSRKSSADTPEVPLLPPPVHKGHRLRSGWLTSHPITAGDQGDPTGGGDTASLPPHVRDDKEFLMASSATGPRTTPPHLAVVVEGTPTVPGPLQQGNQYAGGSYSSSEDKDDSPPLVDLPAVLTTSTATVSRTGVIAAMAPEHLEDVLAMVLEAEHCRNRKFNANMTDLDGRDSRLERMLSDVRGDIAIIREDTTRITSKSIALVELNKITRLAVASNMTDFLQSVEATEVRNRQALEAYKQSITDITEAHNNAMEDMQRQLRSSFNRMKHLERMYKDVPTHVTNHLDKTVPAVVASVVNQTLPATLATALRIRYPLPLRR